MPFDRTITERRKKVTSPAKIVIPPALAIGLALALFQQGIQFFSHLLDRIQRIDVVNEQLVSNCAASKERISYLERAVDKLRNDAGSRADPFTGTQGRDLARQIRDNERRLDALEKSK